MQCSRWHARDECLQRADLTLILLNMDGYLRGSFIVTILFIIHPQHAISVILALNQRSILTSSHVICDWFHMHQTLDIWAFLKWVVGGKSGWLDGLHSPQWDNTNFVPHVVRILWNSMFSHRSKRAPSLFYNGWFSFDARPSTTQKDWWIEMRSKVYGMQ